jgi:hypothetical protein
MVFWKSFCSAYSLENCTNGNERSQKAFIKCIMYSELIIKLFLLEKSSFEWKDIIKVKWEVSIYTGKSISYVYTTFCIIETPVSLIKWEYMFLSNIFNLWIKKKIWCNDQ